MGFKTIETQEELDAIIKERLDRERETTAKKYADYEDLKEKVKGLDDLNEKLKGYQAKEAETAQSINDLTAKVRAYEIGSVKTQIAHELGLPYELAERLSGETEEDIRKDAETFSKFVSKPQIAPMKSSDPAKFDGNDRQKALKELAENLAK